jgi:hypothetical protein
MNGTQERILGPLVRVTPGGDFMMARPGIVGEVEDEYSKTQKDVAKYAKTIVAIMIATIFDVGFTVADLTSRSRGGRKD